MALLAALLLAGGVIGGCSHSVDEVTVTADGTSMVLPPALVCISASGSTELSCAGGETDDGAPHLALAPGTAVDVAVPATVSSTPWVIVFTSRDANGTIQSDRTAVFPPDDRSSYRVEPPVDAQLTRLEVQSLTAAPGADGGIEFPAIGTWVLVIDPADGPQ